MAINERLIDTQAAAASALDDNNLILELDAGDVDSYDGDGDVWYDIHDFEFKPTTSVSEHFNTVLYTGDANTTAQPITQVGFTPDLVWIKTTNQGVRHILTDSVRGVDSQIFSSENSSESNYGEFNTFDSDGFTVKRNTSTDYLNQSGIDYVAWCFKAGGTASLNEEGDTDSQVSVNNNLGFSIVSYNGNGVNTSVGHGLDVPPELTFTKRIGGTGTGSNAGDWVVGSGNFNSAMYLNTTAADNYPTNYFFNGAPSSTVINFKNDWFVNGSNNEYITYCFTSKRGVSKVGSYRGTGAVGNKIYTGFEPAFLMIKGTDQTTSDWIMLDNKRDTSNPNSARLDANSNLAEYTGEDLVDFNRDGFTLVTSSVSKNGNNKNFIYYAVAKDTNETSLIPSTDLELHLDASTYTTGSTWTDSSGNSNNGTITGASYDAELGDFFEFDGTDDKVEIPMDFSGDGSIEAWVNLTNINEDNIIASKYEAGTDNRTFAWYIYGSGNAVFSTYYNSSGAGNAIQFSMSDYFTSGKWHHIMHTFGASSRPTIYIDGEAISESSQYNSSSQNIVYSRPSVPVVLGDWYNPTNNTYDLDGKIGQFRLYSTALSQEQVRQNYNFTKPKYPNVFHGDINGATHNTGGYFDFDGSNDNVDITGNPLGPNNFTYSAWFNADTVSVPNQNIITSDAGHVNYGLQVTGTGLSMYALNSSGTQEYLVSSTGLVSSGTWYHVAYVKSSISGHSLYLNGTVVASDSSFTGDCDLGTLSETTIGSANNNIQWFNGKISKVKLYNKALIQTEIDALNSEGY